MRKSSSGTSAARESRDDYKKRKEIEEARKAGTLPPEVDNEGNMINPHIPEYMSKAPWYLNQEEGAGLKHQRLSMSDKHRRPFASSIREEDEILRERKRKILSGGKRAKRYRKGACKNCGAMTHQAKDCLERPRKKGAFVTGKRIAADDGYVARKDARETLKQSWDGKRDRWAGFDPDQHKKTIEMYRIAEKAREKVRRREMEIRRKEKEEKRRARRLESERKEEDAGSSSNDSDSDSSDSDEDEDLADVRLRSSDETQQFKSKHATFIKQSVRNLRIREDLPKYLRNLDPNSAHYDPKTRSMRANPTPNVPVDQLTYAGDNFVRYSGDSIEHAKSQVYAWDAYKGGVNVNSLADPTKTAMMQKISKKRKEEIEEEKQASITDTYGRQDAYTAPDRSLLLGETETMHKYTRDGRRIDESRKDGVAEIPKTKYEEDVKVHNHTAVWGSFYDIDERAWGYACCWQLTKMAYCTGEAGKNARRKAKAMKRQHAAKDTSTTGKGDGSARKMLVPRGEGAGGSAGTLVGTSRSELYGNDDATRSNLDPKKLREAIERQKRGDTDASAIETAIASKKYHSIGGLEENVTAEDMEAYRITRIRKEDPMAAFLGRGDDDDDEKEGMDAASGGAKKKKKKKKKRRRRRDDSSTGSSSDGGDS